jgi:heme O synthase-like polyprenyltransferase
MIGLLFLCFPAYVVAQVVAFCRLRHAWLWIASVPAAVMVLVVVATAVAFVQQSPQWPLLLLFLSPPALFFVIGLLVVHTIIHSKDETHVV